MNCFLKNFPTKNLAKHFIQTKMFSYSSILESKKVPEEAIPLNTLEKYYSTHLQPFGEIYDARPFRVKLEADKKYVWCCCGHSKSQPFCDGTHNIKTLNITIKPIFFKVTESKEYWLCNCKQSSHRPFCDGTHLKEEILTKNKYFKT